VCLVTEFMERGSLKDILIRDGAQYNRIRQSLALHKPSQVLKLCIDIAQVCLFVLFRFPPMRL